MKLRIQQDKYDGYEVVVFRWYWPFWVLAGGMNTFKSVESAEEWAIRWVEKQKRKGVVKYL